jgi:hypothetical protein
MSTADRVNLPMPGGPGSWTTRYEDLRREVLSGCLSGGCWGLALFMRQGLAAWMRAWPPGAEPAGPSGHSLQQPLIDRSSLPSNLHAQVVAVLVNMVLGGS